MEDWILSVEEKIDEPIEKISTLTARTFMLPALALVIAEAKSLLSSSSPEQLKLLESTCDTFLDRVKVFYI